MFPPSPLPTPFQPRPAVSNGEIVSRLLRQTSLLNLDPGPRSQLGPAQLMAIPFSLYPRTLFLLSKYLHSAGCCPPCTTDMKLHVIKASHSTEMPDVLSQLGAWYACPFRFICPHIPRQRPLKHRYSCADNGLCPIRPTKVESDQMKIHSRFLTEHRPGS